MIAIGFNEASIDYVGIRRSNGNVNHATRNALRQQTVTLQVATGAGMVYQFCHIIANKDMTINSSHNSVVAANLNRNCFTFNGS